MKFSGASWFCWCSLALLTYLKVVCLFFLVAYGVSMVMARKYLAICKSDLGASLFIGLDLARILLLKLLVRVSLQNLNVALCVRPA